VQSVNHVDSLSQLIFSPDPLSGFQHEKVHGAKQREPDDQALRALMFAVLEDGIACFQGYFFKPSRTNERLYCEVEEWIHSDDDGPFSFNNICDTLGLDPGRLRKGLKQWKARQMRMPPERRERVILTKGKRLGKR